MRREHKKRYKNFFFVKNIFQKKEEETNINKTNKNTLMYRNNLKKSMMEHLKTINVF